MGTEIALSILLLTCRDSEILPPCIQSGLIQSPYITTRKPIMPLHAAASVPEWGATKISLIDGYLIKLQNMYVTRRQELPMKAHHERN